MYRFKIQKSVLLDTQMGMAENTPTREKDKWEKNPSLPLKKLRGINYSWKSAKLPHITYHEIPSAA